MRISTLSRAICSTDCPLESIRLMIAIDGGTVARATKSQINRIDAFECTSRKRSTLDEDDHGQGWCEDFLQGLGKGPADRLFARLAAFVRRLGQSDAVLWSAWIPRCCP